MSHVNSFLRKLTLSQGTETHQIVTSRQREARSFICLPYPFLVSIFLHGTLLPHCINFQLYLVEERNLRLIFCSLGCYNTNETLSSLARIVVSVTGFLCGKQQLLEQNPGILVTIIHATLTKAEFLLRYLPNIIICFV